MTEIKSCRLCGAPIARPPKMSSAMWSQRKFCGRACMSESQREKPSDRFERLTGKGSNGCWLWLGKKDRVNHAGRRNPNWRHGKRARTAA